jgi:hypothetical protein
MHIGQTAHLPEHHYTNYFLERGELPRSYALGPLVSFYLQKVEKAARVGFEPTRRLNTAYSISNCDPYVATRSILSTKSADLQIVEFPPVSFKIFVAENGTRRVVLDRT